LAGGAESAQFGKSFSYFFLFLVRRGWDVLGGENENDYEKENEAEADGRGERKGKEKEAERGRGVLFGGR